MKQATKQNPQLKKVKLTRVSPQERTGKNGPFISLGICIDGFDGWLNGYGDEINALWETGSEVEILVWSETYKDKDGKEQTGYKFKLPPDKIGKAEFNELKDRVKKLELELSDHLESKKIVDKVKDMLNGEEVPPLEDLPF